MATSGQFSWPSVGISVAAYGQLVMAADSTGPGYSDQLDPRVGLAATWPAMASAARDRDERATIID